MLNEFLKSIGGDLTDKLSGSTDLDSSKVSGVANVVTDVFKSGISEKATSGGIGDILGLLGQGGSSSSFAGTLVNNTVGKLVSKLGLPEGIANKVATVAVPFIINKFGSFAKEQGKDSEEGIGDLLGDVMTGSLKDKLIGGLGKKFGF